jgi:hypothetical protein
VSDLAIWAEGFVIVEVSRGESVQCGGRESGRRKKVVGTFVGWVC